MSRGPRKSKKKSVALQAQEAIEAMYAETPDDDFGQSTDDDTPDPPQFKPEAPAEESKALYKQAIAEKVDLFKKVEDCLTRMEISREQVEEFPVLRETLESVGGPESTVEYLRSSSVPEARSLVRYWDNTPAAMRGVLPFESYVVAARMTKKQFLQALIGEVCEQSDAQSVLLAATRHPEVMKKTIAVALSDSPSSSEARKLLHQHRGILPTPKTQRINVFGDVNQDNRNSGNTNQTINIADLDKAQGILSNSVERFNELRMSVFEDVEFSPAEPTEDEG